jgi:hypothetical protein
MKLTTYSRNLLFETFARWDVPKDFADPFYNYLVHGFEPGGCFTGILANDFYGAIQRSHPANTIQALKCLSGWIQEEVPEEARGSYEAVNSWCNLSAEGRRTVLEEHRLIYTSEEEVWMTLQDKPTYGPMVYD